MRPSLPGLETGFFYQVVGGQLFDTYLKTYKTQRPHQGRNMDGRTPYQAFKDGMPNNKKRAANKAA